MKKKILCLLIMPGLMACSHKTLTTDSDKRDNPEPAAVVAGFPSQLENEDVPESILNKNTFISGNYQNMIPDATAFRMSGDYENNVAITLASDGTLTYFPAPSDITADSEPVALGDGWWLNCQGISPNSVFTKYTFAEYASLPSAPTPEQLKHSIIPGAKVTEFIELPVKADKALQNIEEIKAYIRNK